MGVGLHAAPAVTRTLTSSNRIHPKQTRRKLQSHSSHSTALNTAKCRDAHREESILRRSVTAFRVPLRSPIDPVPSANLSSLSAPRTRATRFRARRLLSAPRTLCWAAGALSSPRSSFAVTLLDRSNLRLPLAGRQPTTPLSRWAATVFSAEAAFSGRRDGFTRGKKAPITLALRKTEMDLVRLPTRACASTTMSLLAPTPSSKPLRSAATFTSGQTL